MKEFRCSWPPLLAQSCPLELTLGNNVLLGNWVGKDHELLSYGSLLGLLVDVTSQSTSSFRCMMIFYCIVVLERAGTE